MFRERAELTHVVELVSSQSKRQNDSVRQPFPLGDETSEDEKASGNVDVVEVSPGSQRFSHFESNARGSSPQKVIKGKTGLLAREGI